MPTIDFDFNGESYSAEVPDSFLNLSEEEQQTQLFNQLRGTTQSNNQKRKIVGLTLCGLALKLDSQIPLEVYSK